MKTYGTVQHRDGWFIIRCEAHVAIRLKRVFQKIRSERTGVFTLSETPENCRDLEWFMERYPLSINGAAGIVKAGAEAHKEKLSLVDKLLNSRVEALPFDLAVPLREYQAVSTHLAATTKALLMADDVGLGKTAQAIALLTTPGALPALFVTLTHLPRQMERQIKKFAPNLRTHILKKGTPYEFKGGLPDVIISNYHKLGGWDSTLAGIVKTVIFDECQELRHGGTIKYMAAARIRNDASLCAGLSATPFHNYGGEMWNVMDVIAPGSLGSRDEFITEWCRDMGRNKVIIKDPVAFGSYLRDSGLMLRRTRKEVGREIKEPIVIPHEIDTDKAELDKLSAGCAELAKIILANTESYRGEKLRVSQEFDMRLRQATGIAKAPFVAEFVRLLLDSEQKVILYGWHRTCYDIWQERLADLNPVMYTGSESTTQKEHAIQQFLKGDSRVMLISLRAGQGLDGLQDVCSVVVFGELDWSPAVHEQCIGRLWRDKTDGTPPDPVVAYYLISEDGSDPFVSDALGLKKQQIEGIRGERDLVTKLEIDPNHIKNLAKKYLEERQ